MPMLLVLSLAAVPAANAAQIHTFEGSFGTAGTGPGQLSLRAAVTNAEQKVGGSGLAIDEASGDVYVADTGNHRVDEFDPSKPVAERFVRAFGADVGGPGIDVCTTSCVAGTATEAAGGFEAPVYVAVDNSGGASAGDVYVADTTTNLVSKFTAAGALITGWGNGGRLDGSAAEHGPFTSIAGIATDTAGNLSVYDGAQERWFEFSQAGTPDPTIGVGRATTPVGIAVDGLGRLYKFVGFGNLEQYGATGADIAQVDTGEADTGLALSLATDDIYVDEAGGTSVEHFGPSCASGAAGFPCPVVDAFGSASAEGGELLSGAGLAVTASGTVYLADAGRQRIDAFAAAEVPDATTEAPTAVEQHSSTLHGSLDPAGAGEVTACEFQYGTTTAYGQSAPCAEGQSFTAPTSVHADLTGLQPDSGYHFRLVVSNAQGRNHGADETFTTTGPPIVGGEGATAIGQHGATLGASIDPSGYETTWHFEYGTEAGVYPHATPNGTLAPGHGAEPVEAPISGLTLGTTYHFRAVAESECEPLLDPGHVCVVDGPDARFSTLPAISLRGLTTQTVGPELVVIKAELDPNGGGPVHYTIHYGPAAGTYTSGSVEGTVANGTEFETVEATFPGLTPNTTYHYQLTAESPAAPGRLESTDLAFTTEISPAEERAAESCANIALREQDSALFLADCRDYEQVSPTAKEGYPLTTGSGALLAPGGESTVFKAAGAFAGATANNSQAPYISGRTSSGWLTRPAWGRPGPGLQPLAPEGYTADLASSLFTVIPRPAGEFGQLSSSPNAFYIGRPDGSFQSASPTLAPLSGKLFENGQWDRAVAQSADFSHLFLKTSVRLLPEDPRADGASEGELDRIYGLSGAGGPSPSLRLLAEVPSGVRSESCRIDSAFGRALDSSTADGSTLFYDAPLELQPGGTCENESVNLTGPNKAAVFACHAVAGPCVEGLAGYHPPLELSAEDPAECSAGHPCHGASPQNAHLYGISPDGRLAWFTTTQPLIDSDTDQGNDLYLARLTAAAGLESLVQVSSGAEPAQVQGVLEVSQDGGQASFVARGVLASAPNSAGAAAAPGADNLYLYDSGTGTTRFVARLCSGPGLSGSLAEPACPAAGHNDSALWSLGAATESQLTADGRYLLFTSYGRLTAGDTDAAKDLYRYDSSTGELIRLSIGRRGNDGDGNDDAFDATIAAKEPGGQANSIGILAEAAEDNNRAISSDGSLVVFRTAAPLVSTDTNAAADPGCGISAAGGGNEVKQTGCDVYQWQQQGHGGCSEPGGCVSLVSSGRAPLPAEVPIIGESGRDIIFRTSVGLVPSDTDGVADVYDAREGGGFRYVPPPAPCGGAELCHGSAATAPAAPKITTAAETGGNGAKPKQCGKGKVAQKRHGQTRCVAKKHHRRKHHKRKHSKSGNQHQRGDRNRGGAK